MGEIYFSTNAMPGEVTVFVVYFEKIRLVLLLPSRTEDHLALLQAPLVLAGYRDTTPNSS